jgi:hypothetical protein
MGLIGPAPIHAHLVGRATTAAAAAAAVATCARTGQELLLQLLLLLLLQLLLLHAQEQDWRVAWARLGERLLGCYCSSSSACDCVHMDRTGTPVHHLAWA